MQAKGEEFARRCFIFWEESGNGPLASSFLSSNAIPQHLGGSKNKKGSSYKKSLSEIGQLEEKYSMTKHLKALNVYDLKDPFIELYI